MRCTVGCNPCRDRIILDRNQNVRLVMATPPRFASIGKTAGKIDVRLSYRIVELFSEGLYASPNKALEELVANSFDAGALHVQLLLSPNLEAQDATIVVIDDGAGMGAEGLTQHWLIGSSNKREAQLSCGGIVSRERIARRPVIVDRELRYELLAIR